MNLLSNTARGRQFQRLAKTALIALTGADFEEEVRISIGNPQKDHAFDLASKDRSYVAECKAFTFTASGNIPSAKITTLREAVNYLCQLPEGTKRFLVMKRSQRPGHQESLAEYFVRLNASLLGNVCIIEVSEDGTPRLICGTLA